MRAMQTLASCADTDDQCQRKCTRSAHDWCASAYAIRGTSDEGCAAISPRSPRSERDFGDIRIQGSEISAAASAHSGSTSGVPREAASELDRPWNGAATTYVYGSRWR